MKSANQDPNSRELIKAIVIAYVSIAIVATLILLLKFKS